MYIEYVAHANNHRGNQIVENSWWALARMRVGRHGAQTEHFREECQSNRMKENDEAMSIMLNYH